MLSSIRYTILLYAIGFASPVWAVSIYDVIELSEQDYSDEEIVQIIRTTRSVFELTAEDIPRLASLGVSEPVIRAMLVAAPSSSSESEVFFNDTDDRERIPLTDADVTNDLFEDITAEISNPLPDAHPAGHVISPALTANWFAVRLVSEEAAGDHQHAYVTLTDVPVLILRDEGHFPTVEHRGEAVARNLEAAARAGAGRFEALHANGADVVVYHGTDLRKTPIVTVNGRDVHAYDVRSERRVTSDLLAAYWAALLNDYWAIAFRHQAPSRLVNLHRGDAFVLLFDLVRRSRSDVPVNLGSAVQQLPGTIRGHLERLAQSVPEDFEDSPEGIGEAS